MSAHKESVEIATSIVSDQLPFRRWLYAWLLDPNIEGNYQKSLDRFIAVLIVGCILPRKIESLMRAASRACATCRVRLR